MSVLYQVSLLWNAVLSRLLLRERFSVRTLAGTCLIATGASLIAVFGVVPEENHTLEELMSLFRRKGFAVYIALMSIAVVVVLAVVSSADVD
jgi:drug/metabolite transporter (DMT)-like permease